MNEIPRRPFYTEYAWAFDLLIDRPVRKECAVIAAWLVDRGVLPGSEVLDAGCGTGRYALELPLTPPPERTLADLVGQGAALVSLTPVRDTLEDFFVRQVSGAQPSRFSETA